MHILLHGEPPEGENGECWHADLFADAKPSAFANVKAFARAFAPAFALAAFAAIARKAVSRAFAEAFANDANAAWQARAGLVAGYLAGGWAATAADLEAVRQGHFGHRDKADKGGIGQTGLVSEANEPG